MSVKTVKAFFEKVQGDKKLKAKLDALRDKTKAHEDQVMSEVVKIAKSAGFEFTVEDLAETRTAAAHELSEDELKQVAGGQRMGYFWILHMAK